MQIARFAPTVAGFVQNMDRSLITLMRQVFFDISHLVGLNRSASKVSARQMLKDFAKKVHAHSSWSNDNRNEHVPLLFSISSAVSSFHLPARHSVQDELRAQLAAAKNTLEAAVFDYKNKMEEADVINRASFMLITSQLTLLTFLVFASQFFFLLYPGDCCYYCRAARSAHRRVQQVSYAPVIISSSLSSCATGLLVS